MRHLFILLFSLCASFQVSATILRVNNSPGSTAPYSDLTTAHAVATTGDTIHVEGSNVDYGSLTVSKRLIFIGPGYFTDENPCTPASLPAIVNIFSLDRTDPNDAASGAAGAEIIGLSFTQNSLTSIDVSVNNVQVSKCLIRTAVDIMEDDVTGTVVRQNYFLGKGMNTSSLSPGINNLIFTNNIVNNDFGLPDNSSGTINHNLFLGFRFEVVSFNGEIRSNIATTTSTADFLISTTGTGSITHNTGANGQFGTADNNNTAPANILFVGPSGNSTDGEYQLLSTATLVKANAHDGTDRGAYGGNLPYVLSGVPDLPAIKDIQLNTPNFPSLPLQLTIQAFSGN